MVRGVGAERCLVEMGENVFIYEKGEEAGAEGEEIESLVCDLIGCGGGDARLLVLEKQLKEK